MRQRPVLLSPAKASSEEELPESMPGADLIFLRIFAGAAEIANRFVLGRRRMDFCEEATLEQLRQLACIPPLRGIKDGAMTWQSTP
jgi:hypothetical protein